MRTIIFLFFLLTTVTVSTAAQPVCPTDITLSVGRSGSACFQMGRNQACYGNGSVSASFYSEDHAPFSAPGSIVDARQIESIQVMPVEEGLSVASMLVQATLSDLEERSVALLLYGDAMIENDVAPIPELLVTATGTLNIRATPQLDGEILRRMNINETLVANGRYKEGGWLRVRLPSSQDLGWVSLEVARPDGAVSQLIEVDINTPYMRPYERINVQTGETTFCNGALPSGILLQTPDTDKATLLNINGQELQIAGAVFIQSPEGNTLHLSMLDGWLLVNGAYLPAGTQGTLENGALSEPAPYVAENLAALPTNNLPYRFMIAAPLRREEIAAAIAALQPQPAVVDTTPVATPRPECRRFVTRRTTLWAGPGEFYEAINELPDNARVFPVLQYNGEETVWWQLDNSNWIDASRVYQEGECPDIPVTVVVPRQRYNTISMEQCKTLNGPLHVGQQVRIEFTPPAFESLAAAQVATRVDPGTIKVDEVDLYVYATDPIRLGMADMRYVRTFYTSWTAEGGPHRITSQRLHYDLTCNITVPFG